MNEAVALSTVALAALAPATLAVAIPAARRRLEPSVARCHSLAGHARRAKQVAKRVGALLPGYARDHERFFNSDKVPAKAVSRRRDGLHRLGALFAQPRTRSLALTQQTARGLSDLQFSNACLVPFQRSRGPRKHRQVASLVREPACVTVTDPGGNVFCDLTGTHGVNLLGTAFTSTAQPRALRVPTLWVWCRARTSLVL